MKNHNYDKIKFALVVLALLMLIIGGCSKSEEPPKNSDEPSQDNATGRPPEPAQNGNNPANEASETDYVVEYYPLTFDLYKEIRSNNQNLSVIDITYTYAADLNKDLANDATIDLNLRAGDIGTSVRLNALTSFRGILVERKEGFVPKKTSEIISENDFIKTFTPDDLNEIWDVLELYQSYYFDNDEFAHLGSPYKAEGIHIGDGDYCFTLAVYKPGEENKAWVISKCTDEPKPMFEELISVFKDTFVSEFEN